MLKGREEEAVIVLERVHGKEMANVELMEIKESLKGKQTTPFKDLFKKAVLPIIVIGSVISGLQQFTGINAVLYFEQIFLKRLWALVRMKYLPSKFY